MAGYRLTRRAEEDLAEIGAYTLRTWGAEQCARYLDQLESRCEWLAEDPHLGLASDEVRERLQHLGPVRASFAQLRTRRRAWRGTC